MLSCHCLHGCWHSADACTGLGRFPKLHSRQYSSQGPLQVLCKCMLHTLEARTTCECLYLQVNFVSPLTLGTCTLLFAGMLVFILRAEGKLNVGQSPCL